LKLLNYILLYFLINFYYKYKIEYIFSYWGLGIGDWGLGIGDWAQSPIPINKNYFINFFLYFSILKNNLN